MKNFLYRNKVLINRNSKFISFYGKKICLNNSFKLRYDWFLFIIVKIIFLILFFYFYLFL